MDVELADWERMYRVNTTGPLLGVQALVPLMPPGSSIGTVGSAATLTPHDTVAYTASDGAVRGLAKVASLELGPWGIRSHLVHPGYIETHLARGGAFAVEERQVPGPAGAPDVTVLVCRPTAAQQPIPAVYSVHGGASCSATRGRTSAGCPTLLRSCS